MAVNISRSMNRELTVGAIDHTIRLKQGQDRGGPIDQANYYNNLVGSDTALGMTGEYLVKDYLKGILSSPRPV